MNESLVAIGSVESANSSSGRLLGIAALALSLVAYAFVPILIRWCEVETSPEATMFNRFWIATSILICGLGFQKASQILTHSQQTDLPQEQDQIIDSMIDCQLSCAILSEGSETVTPTSNYQLIGLWAITTVASAASAVVWAWSLRQTSVANSSLMHNLAPLFTTLLGWLFFNAQFELRFLIGTIVAVGGTIILGINDFQLDIDKIQGDVLALFSAVLFGIDLLGVEQLRSQFSSRLILFWVCLVGVVLTVLTTLYLGEPLFPTSRQGWLAVISLAIVGQLLGLGLLTYSLNYLSAGLVALAFLLDPVLTAITAWFAFGETLNGLNLVAFGIILFGIYLGITAQRNQPKRGV